MQLVRESLQVVGGSKARVELRRVGDPVPVVRVTIGRTRAFVVLGDRADPDYGGQGYTHIRRSYIREARQDVLAVNPAS